MASVSAGAWSLSGTGDNSAEGTATTSYAGSGTFIDGDFSSTTIEGGGTLQSYDATINFTLDDEGWVVSNGSASTAVGNSSDYSQETTVTTTTNYSWGDGGNGCQATW